MAVFPVDTSDMTLRLAYFRIWSFEGGRETKWQQFFVLISLPSS